MDAIDKLFAGALPMDQQVGDLMDLANSQTDQINQLDNSLNIIARNSVTINYNSGTFSYPDATIALASGIANAFLCYLVRSDRPNNLYYVPYYEVIGNSPANLTMEAHAYTQSGNLILGGTTVTSYPGTPPASLTFYYLILQQPANPAVS